MYCAALPFSICFHFAFLCFFFLLQHAATLFFSYCPCASFMSANLCSFFSLSISFFSSKTIQINIIDDEEYEKNKNFFLEIGEPQLVEMSERKGGTSSSPGPTSLKQPRCAAIFWAKLEVFICKAKNYKKSHCLFDHESICNGSKSLNSVLFFFKAKQRGGSVSIIMLHSGGQLINESQLKG